MGSLKVCIDEKYKELESLTEMNNAKNVGQINKVRDDINALLLQDELFWRQRSRAIWLPARDKNTKYFIKGQTKDEGKIRLLGLWMKVEDDVPQTLRSLGWLNHISKIYFLQPT